MTDKEIIKENDRRLHILFAPYDPVTGQGSLIERFPFKIFNNTFAPTHLPVAMKETYGKMKSLEDAFPGEAFKNALITFQADRFKHDFEFWAFTTVKIKSKLGGELIPFRLNRPQRRLVQELERMRLANKPIRLILCKCRQWGGSTLIQIYASWIQLIHKTNWNSMIAAHLNGPANNIRYMYRTVINEYPAIYGKYSWIGFEGTQNSRMIKERSCKITIGSMETPDSIRSDDIAIAHLSEVGIWKETKGKKPKDLIQSISGSIPEVPYSMFVLESTAKGIGNYFHQTWQAANKPNSNMLPFFVPWHETEMDTQKFDNNYDRLEFYHSMDEYEKKLWDEHKATLEGIKWYRGKFNSAEIDCDKWVMNSENPSSIEEAFQATGKKAFRPDYIATVKENLKKPILVGDIFADGREGKEAFKNLAIKETTKGNLHVWAMPNNPPLPENMVLKGGRYAIAVDIGGKSKGSDKSTINGFDRYYMAKGMTPERAFTWRGNIDPDLLAWKAAQLAYIYEKGLLAFEINTYNQDQNTEGDHGFTIVDTVADFYDNMFTRTTPDQIREGVPNKWGFHTNKQSKGMIIDNLNRLMRLNLEAGAGWVEYDENMYYECDYYEIKENGSMGAVEGQHDDVLMGSAIGLWMCTSYMDAPLLVPKESGLKNRKVLESAANF